MMDSHGFSVLEEGKVRMMICDLLFTFVLKSYMTSHGFSVLEECKILQQVEPRSSSTSSQTAKLQQVLQPTKQLGHGFLALGACWLNACVLCGVCTCSFPCTRNSIIRRHVLLE
jgi:hypothetical protein